MQVLARKHVFIGRTLSWYKLNGRKFSWRQRRLTPYETLVLEIMLRRTTAERVEKIFPVFIKKYPSPRVLYRARECSLSSDLKTLGLKNRVKILRKLAEEIVRKWAGKIPDKFNDLIQLPGVGIYTANAVLCFSLGKRVPLVDTNVARVLQRVFGLPSRDPGGNVRLWILARKLLPQKNVMEFNWGLIDLGSMVCRPKNPLCGYCPIHDLCSYART
jgi:A/G-specific adenine glycosylase